MNDILAMVNGSMQQVFGNPATDGQQEPPDANNGDSQLNLDFLLQKEPRCRSVMEMVKIMLVILMMIIVAVIIIIIIATAAAVILLTIYYSTLLL